MSEPLKHLYQCCNCLKEQWVIEDGFYEDCCPERNCFKVHQCCVCNELYTGFKAHTCPISKIPIENEVIVDMVWDRLLQEAVDKANALHKKKGKDYGHFSEYPDVVLASAIYLKAKRLVELTVKEAVGQAATFEPIDDSCLDAVNYLRFLYAKQQKKRGRIV